MMLAYAVFSRAGGLPYKRETLFARKRELREQGLVLAQDLEEPVEVDLQAVLERALEAPAWDG